MTSAIKAIRSRNLHTVVATLTRPANTTAYTALDTVGAGFSWLVPVRNAGIIGARITSSGTVATSLDGELLLFHTAISTNVDNAALVMTDAEALTRIGSIDFPVANWRLWSANSGCDGRMLGGRLDVPVQTRGGNDALVYGQLIARNAYVPINAEVITIELVVELY